jgi:replicative DNA helicase
MAVEPDIELLSHLPDPESWVVLRGEGFRDALIEDPAVLAIYQWADQHYREHGQVATAAVLDEEFEIDFTEPETAIGDLIDRMRTRYMKNQGRDAMRAIGDQFKEDPSGVPKLLLQQGRELTDLLSRHGEMYGTGDVDRTLKGYLDKATKGPGPSLGFKTLDDYFYGQRGITVYAGPPKTWKSWFMVKGVIENIFQGTYPWLYPLELPAEETNMRLICMISDIPWHKYIHNTISRDERRMMKEVAKDLDEMGVYKIVQPPQGERSVDSLIGKAQDAGAGSIWVDQLQYVEVEGKSLGAWNETGKYWEVLDRSRNLTDNICYAHQFNRSVMNADKMPSVQQLKGSSAIEETATLALGLWASKEMRKSKRLEVGTLISRNHDFRNWEVEVDLTHRCNFDITGVVEDDE